MCAKNEERWKEVLNSTQHDRGRARLRMDNAIQVRAQRGRRPGPHSQ